ncbi:TrkH family potassium uptake protein [Brevundimonas sp.]|uniref:TrkH family potassium uptake protein n=1 Tax=Brevundimonas sp. TaxID=1871086 RepID=UPI003AF984E4
MTRALRGLRLWLGTLSTPRLLLLGYGAYMLAGWLLLALPIAHSEPVRLIDSLFIAVSAVSTTGLVSIDPGGSFNLFGEIVILALIQAGGLGYMTLGSIAALALKRRLSLAQQHAAIGAFGLPVDFDLRRFLREIGGFVLCVEAVGAVILWILFARAGVENALWAGIFHSVSAFCTAGFSLFANSLEDFRADTAVNLVVALLAYLGAIGFLVFADIWENLRGRRQALGFVSRVILVTTLAFSAFGTLLLYVFEPTIAALSGGERALAAFFQAMTATTTVGFNTVPMGPLAVGSVMVMYLLMMFGASPAGTGGGLKSTTLATLVALVVATLRGQTRVRVLGHAVPPDRIQLAAASISFYVLVLFVAVFGLAWVEAAPLEALAFEAISAIGTVGLSTGVTGGLTDPGKATIIALMFMGRVGVLTFGLALAANVRRGPGERARPDDLIY